MTLRSAGAFIFALAEIDIMTGAERIVGQRVTRKSRKPAAGA
jgi:hypothetical protein